MSSQPEGDIKTQEELLNDLEYGTPEERAAALSHLALVVMRRRLMPWWSIFRSTALTMTAGCLP